MKFLLVVGALSLALTGCARGAGKSKASVQGRKAPACKLTREALSRLSPPAFFDAHQSGAWPPAEKDGSLCDFSAIDDLDGDGLPEFAFACDSGTAQWSYQLYHQRPDGCLQDIGGVEGKDWEVAEGPKNAGFPPLTSWSRPSQSEQGVEIAETHYEYDASQQRYVIQSSKPDVEPQLDW